MCYRHYEIKLVDLHVMVFKDLLLAWSTLLEEILKINNPKTGNFYFLNEDDHSCFHLVGSCIFSYRKNAVYEQNKCEPPLCNLSI
jgi:hypothetical protein